MTIEVQSSAFGPQETIPKKHTGDGQDASPPLSWSGVPEGTVELALIVDDPDAPRPEPWVHWVLYKIPAGTSSLPEGVPASPKLTEPGGAVQGTNSFGNVGYGGPAPPKGHGTHHYRFRVYALDAELSGEAERTAEAIKAEMEGHVLAWGELVGTYAR